MLLSERMILAYRVAKLIYRRRLYRKSPLLRNPLRLYRFLSANPLKNTHPIALQIEITSRCNLSCCATAGSAPSLGLTDRVSRNARAFVFSHRSAPSRSRRGTPG
jgi:hypothetical protein